MDTQGTEKIALAAKREPTKFTPARPTSARAAAVATDSPGIGFFCHSDVVSVDGWDCPHGGPFSGVVADGRMWGRGACDMKGPIAAALVAVAQTEVQQQRTPIYFFVTGDEECGMAGARLLVQQSASYREMVERRVPGLICEPTSLQVVNAHKGGCHLDVTSHGVAAHSSTAEGQNANWQMIPFLQLVERLNARCHSDASLQNQQFSPPTLTMNVVLENVPQSTNITVAKATCRIFFRPMPDTDWQSVLEELLAAARHMDLEVNLKPPLGPLYTSPATPLVQTALKLLGQDQPHAVSYATDGCCFDELSELIVIGPGNIAQAHRSDEWIEVQQLHHGVRTYRHLLEHYVG